MDVKDAVRAARDFVALMYHDEEITDIGLEEVEFDECSEHWRVTIGFSRPWDKTKSVPIRIADVQRPRFYKVVRISDSDGEIISLKDRILVMSD